MELAPIALFVYDRLDHTQRTVKALQNNRFAKESELFIFSDGPKDGEPDEKVMRVREYIRTIKGFGRVAITERMYNLGLSGSITAGVTELIAKYGRVIVLEDDLVTSPYFLKFMNDGLSVYRDEEKVISICGYMYPVNERQCDTLFFRVADVWGWATWKRGWDLFIADGERLYNRLKAEKLLKNFNLDGAFNYAKILKMKALGRNDSWDVCLYASSLLNGKLSLFPWKSLVVNTGFDGSGRHRGVVDYYKTDLSDEPVIVKRIPVLENERAARKIGLYLKRQRFDLIRRTSEFVRKRLGVIHAE